MDLHDFVGLAGITLIVGSYFLLQAKWIRSDDRNYSVFNCFGALCVLYSIGFDFNLSAFVIEIFWVIISAMGIVRYFWGTSPDQADEGATS